MLKIAAIIPVKTFSRAKTRLDLPAGVRIPLCEMMLEELLHTLSANPQVSDIVIVTRDRAAAEMAGRFGAAVIPDTREEGVNQAVSLADGYVKDNGVDATMVLPQDIPFTKTQDIDFLLRIQIPPSFVTIVPSRRFDGTNALLRMPHGVMGTHYDRDSYRAHVDAARKMTPNPSVLFVRRMMIDIDDIDDLGYALKRNEKPEFCERVKALVNQGASSG